MIEEGIVELIVDNDDWKDRVYPTNQPDESLINDIEVSSIELWKQGNSQQIIIRDTENQVIYIYDINDRNLDIVEDAI